MSERPPVERRHVVVGASPAQVYDVVSDFPSYPRLFPEMKATRVLSGAEAPRAGGTIRVEFRLQIVLPVRYVLEMNLGWFAKKGLKAGFKLGGEPFSK